MVVFREKKGRLEVRRGPDIENLVDAVDRVQYIVILSLQLEYTSYHSWAALNIGRRYGTPFAAFTSTGLSTCRPPGPDDDSPRQFSSTPYFSPVVLIGTAHRTVYLHGYFFLQKPPAF